MNANLTAEISKATQSSNVKIVPKLLKTGDSALVRVIADRGNGRYEGFVAGVKVAFSSARPLTVGTSFPAKVQVNGNTIILFPKKLLYLFLSKILILFILIFLKILFV